MRELVSISRRLLPVLAAGVFVAGAHAATTRRISVDTNGSNPNGSSSRPSVSANGKTVAYTSFATDLVAADANALPDVFVHNDLLGTTVRASVSTAGVESNGVSQAAAISADGRFVAFQSLSTNLVAGDLDPTKDDILLRDLVNNTTERASLNNSGQPFGNAATDPAISGDGNLISFSTTQAIDLGDDNALPDVYVRNRTAGTTVHVSVDSTGQTGNGFSNVSAIAADGRFVAFQSTSSDLVANDTNGTFDIFVRDLDTSTTELVSIDPSGVQFTGTSIFPSISANGRFVAFESDVGGVVQVFVRDRTKGKTVLVSKSKAGGVSGNADSGGAQISGNGKFVTFRSSATNLLASDATTTTDIYKCKRSGKGMKLVSQALNGVAGGGDSDNPSIDKKGKHVAFQSEASDLVNGDGEAHQDVFIR